MLFIGFDHNTERFEDFLNGLVEFGLSRVLRNYLLENFINIRHKIPPFLLSADPYEEPPAVRSISYKCIQSVLKCIIVYNRRCKKT